MNLFKYINSKDIRKHLEEIDYQFNTLEAAYLIYFCRSLTLAERHKAFSLSNAVLKEEHSVFSTVKNAGFSVLGNPAFVMR